MTSRRTTPLPKGWARIRKQVFSRDGWSCVICGSEENLECDHIGAPDDHRIEALRTLCKQCHARRTAIQANRFKPQKKRPTNNRHPGLN